MSLSIGEVAGAVKEAFSFFREWFKPENRRKRIKRGLLKKLDRLIDKKLYIERKAKEVKDENEMWKLAVVHARILHSIARVRRQIERL